MFYSKGFISSWRRCQMNDLLWQWAKTKWNEVWREALCFPSTWKILCPRKSNESLRYNHMFMCHANITLVKDVIEVGHGCAVADQIQLASWWQSWKRSTLTASYVYKYVLVEISLRVTPSTFPYGVPIAHTVISPLLYINICTSELLGCAASNSSESLRERIVRPRETRDIGLSGWI